MLVAAGLFQWFGLPIYSRYVAIREIERLGGRIESEKGGPTWLREWIGDERMKGFDEVDMVSSEGPLFTGKNLAHLNDLSQLTELRLTGPQIKDADLTYLKGLTNLRRLAISESQVTDKGLAHLKELINLELLALDGASITDAGLANLTGMTNLKSLYLRRTRITNAGIANLKSQLPGLVTMDGFVLNSAGAKPLAPNPVATPNSN